MGGRGQSSSREDGRTIRNIVARSWIPAVERMSQDQADRERERLEGVIDKAKDGSFEKTMAEAKLDALNDRKPELNERDRTSFNTRDAVEKVQSALKDGSMRDAREALDGIRDGQKITISSRSYSNGVDQKDVLENPEVWTKRDDGTWASDRGGRKTSGELARTLDQGGKNIHSGALTSESRTEITGKFGRDMNGFRFAKGKFDVYKVSNEGGREKVSQAGQITVYNGVQYGIHHDRDGYHITHIPTGLSINSGHVYPKSMTDVTNYIRETEPRVMQIAGLKEMEERFKKTRRGD